MRLSRSDLWPERIRLGIVLALIAACFLWGGGSRRDIPGLLLLQPLAVIATAAILLVPGPIRWGAIRAPLILLAGLAILMVIQLIPLPGALWQALPGHAQFLPFLAVVDGAELWRPLSLTPDLTLASLIGLVVPAAALIGFASLPEDRTSLILPVLLVAVALGAVLGLGQMVGGPDSAFYRYAVTNENHAVGFFSNRNHQAVFLAMAWPMLAVWATWPVRDPQQKRARYWIAGAAAIALLPMVAVTGSRAGVILALVGIGFGWRLARRKRSGERVAAGTRPWLRWALPAGGAAIGLAILALAFNLSRADALQRLIMTDFWREARLAYLPVSWRIAIDFLPFGTGFGSFDPMFRFHETDAMLRPTYLNHAHNDLLELFITGGLPALMLLVGFVWWALSAARAVLGRSSSTGRNLAFLGFAMIVLTLLSSLLDYPLRTPLHAMLFAFASAWLAQGAQQRRAG